MRFLIWSGTLLTIISAASEVDTKKGVDQQQPSNASDQKQFHDV
ncbi:hypothetical protein YTPLAS18_11760 [Nitrospira sp.]|nr:hypothetical protein YTPLAS18_11760 [Nitrospira sp.]